MGSKKQRYVDSRIDKKHNNKRMKNKDNRKHNKELFWLHTKKHKKFMTVVVVEILISFLYLDGSCGMFDR